MKPKKGEHPGSNRPKNHRPKGRRQEGGYRLLEEISPYLRSQAKDPVEWYPWGEEALVTARQQGKPIFLSVGYSTCRWCHIMARESFNDTTVSGLLNQHFINIKVDREERPDIDEIYMAATQIYNHGGGWPNTVFLTPEGKPYFCGTFVPLEDGPEEPGFRTMAESMAHAWQHRRDEVMEQATELATVMERFLTDRGPRGTVPGAEVVQGALASLLERFDESFGGFGDGAKFTMPANLLFLLELADHVPKADLMLRSTLDAMTRGGIHDVLGGGFHRFTTDRQWRRPHFEKLLADNGWLLQIFARQALRGDDLARQVTRRTADFLCREMGSAGGAFATALDGETDGREGEYYLWNLGQLVEVLGEENAGFLAPFLGYDGDPLLADRFVLRWQRELSDEAARRRQNVEDLRAEVEPLIAQLGEARHRRPRPFLDDKILCDANGIVIAGLATASEALADPSLLERAGEAARWLLDHLRDTEGRLRHAYREGNAGFGAFLNDYAGLLWGLLALAQRDSTGAWLHHAEEIADEMVKRLWDAQDGGLWNASEDPERPFRNKEIFDGAYPSSNALALLSLLELDRLLGGGSYGKLVTRSLQAFAVPARDQVESLRAMAIVVHRLLLKSSDEEVS